MIRNALPLYGILSLLLAFSLNASSPVRFGFNAGIVSPAHLHTTLGAGGLLDYTFDLGASGSIHFQPSVEFWYSSDDHYYYYQGRYPYYGYWWRVFEVSINPNGKYYLPVPVSLKLKPFLGLGLALSFPDIDYEYIYPDYPPPYYRDRFDIGFNGMIGFDFRMGRNAIGFIELRGKTGYISASKVLFGMMFPVGR